MTIEATLPAVTFRKTTVGGAAQRYRGAVDEIIDLDGLPVGRILVAPIAGVPGGWTVLDLFVRSAHRGRGAATAALRHWGEVARSQGGWLSMSVAADDPHLPYFQRLGFRMVPAAGGRRVGLVMDLASAA
jgi:GNAT superfamily N-acetyltransferase